MISHYTKPDLININFICLHLLYCDYKIINMKEKLRKLSNLSDHCGDDQNLFDGAAFGDIATDLGILKITSRHFMRYTSEETASVIYSVSEGSDFYDDIRCELSTDDVFMFRFYLSHSCDDYSEDDRIIYKLFTSEVINKIKRDYYRKMYEHSLSRDSLTGLATIYYFHQVIAQHLAKQDLCNYTAAYINIKDFSNFNRLFGSETSNNILVHYSRKAEKLFDESKGELLCRLGGDNFVFIALNDRIDSIIEQINDVDLTIKSGDDYLSCTLHVRIGVSKLDNTFTTPSDVLTAIAAALKYSRIPGNPDIVYYTIDTQTRLLDRENFLSELKSAIDNDKLLVYFQPIIGISHEKRSIVGAEALLRWRRQELMLTPADFIPMAEEAGIICKIDLYVLDKVCAKLKEWIDKGIDVVPISCNFSKHDLTEKGLPGSIMSTIDKYGLDHSLIAIEFTEAGFHEEYESIYNIALKLRNEGIKIAIDNFGTGFSSLSLLRDLAFDYLKIDSTIANDVSEKNDIIFENTVNMANKLGYTVICEGINSEQRIDYARSIGCRVFQTDLFAKACSERFFLNYLKKKTDQ